MPKCIKSLTKKQKAMLPIWRDKWIKIGLQTGEVDKKTFEKYIKICYQKANIEFPNKPIIWVSSPLVGGFAASIADKILNSGAVGSAVGSAVNSVVGSVVYSKVDSAVSSEVDSAVGGAVHLAVNSVVSSAVNSAVRSAVSSAVGSVVDLVVSSEVGLAIHSAVDSAVYSEVGSAVRSVVRSVVSGAVDSAVGGAVNSAVDGAALSWHYWLGGQFWAGGWWGSPSFVSFFTDVCGLELSKDISERAEAYRKICESANYIWCNRNFVMACARPVHIDRDEKGRLHSLARQAIEYPDGWGLFMINGVRFLKEEFEKFTSGKMDAIDIMNEKNQDKKRVMIMNYGNEKLLKELKAVKLCEEIDQSGQPMILWKIDRKNEEPMVFYEGIDISKMEKVYLRLPPEFKDRKPIEAKLWTFQPLWDNYQKTNKIPKFLMET